MFGSKSRTRQAELATAEADEAAQVAAEKALAAEEAQEAAREEIRERKRAEREQALAEARDKASDLWSDAQSAATDARDKAQSKAADAKSKAADVRDKAQSKASDAKGRVQDEVPSRSRTSKLLNRSGDKLSEAKNKAQDAAPSGKSGLAGLVGTGLAAKKLTSKDEGPSKSGLAGLVGTGLAAKKLGSSADVASRASDLAGTANSRLSDVRDRALEAYQNSDGVQAARDNALNAAATARQWAAPHVEAARDRGMGLAAPHVENAASNLQPHVDAARDKVVEDLLPRIMEAVSAATAATGAKADSAADNSKAELDKVAGKAKRRSKAAKSAPSERSILKSQKRDVVKAQKSSNRGGGHTVLLVGALGAGAVAAFAAWKSSRPAQDPWAVATASTQPAGTTTQSTTTTSATPQYDAAPTPGPMMAEGVGYSSQHAAPTQAMPQSAGFGVDSDVSEGTMDDVRPEGVSATGSDLPVDSTLERDQAGVDIHQDLLHTDLPQRAPVQAREPFAQETQPVAETPYYAHEEQAGDSVQLDDDALQQFRRNRDILPGQEGNES